MCTHNNHIIFKVLCDVWMVIACFINFFNFVAQSSFRHFNIFLPNFLHVKHFIAFNGIDSSRINYLCVLYKLKIKRCVHKVLCINFRERTNSKFSSSRWPMRENKHTAITASIAAVLSLFNCENKWSQENTEDLTTN